MMKGKMPGNHVYFQNPSNVLFSWAVQASFATLAPDQLLTAIPLIDIKLLSIAQPVSVSHPINQLFSTIQFR